MKVLKSWLKDYIDFELTDEELSDALTFSGSLVEDAFPELDSKIIVAQIEAIKGHPNADRLHLVTVNTGDGQIEIVCGAPNIEVGQKVPLAQLGTKLQDFTIEEAMIRGVKSCGMLCSEKELGLSDDHDGIKILPKEYEVGKPLSEHISGDTVFELEITPNRGDCLSHIGIAREMSAFMEKPLKEEKIQNIETKKDSSLAKIESKNCYRYFATKIVGIKVEPSPLWLQKRLLSLGAKPINNIVDITNYIMLDLGQPLHAFDAKKIDGGQIIIRDAEKNEVTVTLDGEVRNLDEEMLVIADEKKAIALAGVMGGQNSEIDINTTDIILESAEFDRKNVRKTSKVLKLSTDASYRFERGVDPELVEMAIDKAAKMILEICGGEIIEKTSQITNSYKNEWVTIEYERINNLIGIDIKEDQIDKYLSLLGFKIESKKALAPTWRHDVTVWQDLAEEVARLYGLENIKKVAVPTTEKPKRSSYYFKEHVKDIFTDLAFSEVYSYSFLSEKDIKSLSIGADDLLEVANPIQKENRYLRKSLKPGLLRAVAKNPAFDPILIFEIGDVFTTSSEENHLGFVVSGKNAKKLIEETIKTLCSKLNVPASLFQTEELNRDDILRFKIKKPLTYIVEANISKIIEGSDVSDEDLAIVLQQKDSYYRPISKYPSVTRDLAFILNKDIDSAKIEKLIYEESPLVNRVELFDEFASDKFGQNMKNIAYHIDLQHLERTLTDAEADEATAKIVKRIESEFEAKLRNY